MAAIAFMPYGDEERIDRQWESALLTFFYRRLVGLGAVMLGTLANGHLGFRLTPVGRCLLGETEVLEFDTPEETGDVLVQPNFEIVFLAPSVDAQLRTRSYAEPTAALEGPESVRTLFVLRRESVQRAVMAARIRTTSAPHGASCRSIRCRTTWSGRSERGPRRCAGSACAPRWWWTGRKNAARVLAVVGKVGRELSTTSVELLDGHKLTPAMRKKVSDFLTSGGIR